MKSTSLNNAAFKLQSLLSATFYLLLTAHIRTQCDRYIDRTVRAEIVFEKRYKHTRRCDHRVVERICEIIAVFASYANTQTSRLSVAEV